MLQPIHKFRFESYGVVCEISSNEEKLLADAVAVARRSLLGNVKNSRLKPDSRIEVYRTSSSYYRMVRDGKKIASGRHRRKFLKFFDSIVRVSIAEAAPELVFIHAGAVAWNGKGILLPADSFRGKSTLVTELVAAGATYYSDDFAIIDRNGNLLPFARNISMRTDDGNFQPFEIDLSETTVRVGVDPVPIAAVLFTEYRKGSRFVPKQLSVGECMMELIKYALSFQHDPKRTLEFMDRMLKTPAIGLTGVRGEAKKTVKYLIELVDK